MSKWEVLSDDFQIDGKDVVFVHADGTVATHTVGIHDEDKDGNLCFFEIVSPQMLRDSVGGKPKYCRVLIQRVFPCLPADDEGAET